MTPEERHPHTMAPQHPPSTEDNPVQPEARGDGVPDGDAGRGCWGQAGRRAAWRQGQRLPCALSSTRWRPEQRPGTLGSEASAWEDAWPWGRGRPSGRLPGRGLCLPGSALGCGDDPGRKCNQTGAGATSGPACEAVPVRSPELSGHRRRPAPALPARLPQARARPLPETRRTLLTKPHRNTDSKNLFYYRVFRENQRKH